MSDLTEEQKRVKIAEELGWRQFDSAGVVIPMWKSPRGGVAYLPPNYLHDLNDCHEFEETLSDRERLQYVEEIGKLVRQETADSGLNPRAMEDRDVIFRHMHATAALRCEAFGKTKGLW